MAVCKVEGCERDNIRSRGLCDKHYGKWQRYGDPEAGYQRKPKKCIRCGGMYAPELGYSNKYCSKQCRYVCKHCSEPFEPSNKRQTVCADCRHGHLKKTCERCGRTYRTSRPDQRICSRSCVSHRRGQSCTIEGCDDPIVRPVDGWCAKHYAAWQRHGDPLGKCSYKRRCDICGSAFETHIPHKKFCSDACYRERQKHLRKVYRERSKNELGNFEFTCKGCGKKSRSHRKAYTNYCSRECAFENRYEPRTCEQCGAEFKQSDGYNSQYCSDACRDAAYTYTCAVCNASFVAANTQAVTCSAECQKEHELAYRRQYDRQLQEARHREEAKVYKCRVCGREFCIIYGSKMRDFCSEAHRKEWHREQKRLRRRERGTSGPARAKYYGVERRYFNERRILVRDGWKCYICGIDTPAELRGTYEDNAPELDHVVPLSRGGPHRKDNVRCCCRHCNLLKADMTLEEMERSHKTTLRARREYALSQSAERRRDGARRKREAQAFMNSKREKRLAHQLVLFDE